MKFSISWAALKIAVKGFLRRNVWKGVLEAIDELPREEDGAKQEFYTQFALKSIGYQEWDYAFFAIEKISSESTKSLLYNKLVRISLDFYSESYAPSLGIQETRQCGKFKIWYRIYSSQNFSEMCEIILTAAENIGY